jgi:2-polyprenyl-6-methoxyphenol hydroxylase-like FAD-dependent oxidoreductase
MTIHEILVSGAGIAWAAAAYWLREAGFTVTVVERAPAPRPGGQTVDGELAATSADATAATEQEAMQRAFDRYESLMRPYVEQGQELPPGGVNGYAPMSKLRIVLGWASMRWSQRWPMRPMMERIFSKADAIELPEYTISPRLNEQLQTQTGLSA